MPSKKGSNSDIIKFAAHTAVEPSGHSMPSRKATSLIRMSAEDVAMRQLEQKKADLIHDFAL